MINLKEQPHRRFNSLTGEWILVSPHRTQRPWQGQVEAAAVPAGFKYDPACYLCPGNARAGGARNPAYDSTFVFDNDYAALRPDTSAGGINENDLLVAKSERGICRVVCFSPDHSLTVARMEVPDLVKVVDVWTEQYRELASVPFIQSVQIFENRGEMMGASNPHPHCQIWANESLPNEMIKEQARQRAHFEAHKSCLLCDYLALELKTGERVVCQNEHFAVLVPFWAIWPFETLLLSKTHATSLEGTDRAGARSLADILKRITTRYDNLFQVSFPYTMGFHQQPTDGEPHPEWHLHAHYYPPLLRSATVRKFMVGYEMLGSPQRDITAESAAERLRALSEIHYLER
ncbi:MAG TPA: UDP-glucose--hexose-1-phosphate uridylyltransferase [Bryobacteraceae bacterium]